MKYERQSPVDYLATVAHAENRWLIPGLLHRALTLVVGQPTGGKSTWTHELAHAYLTGEPFMGQPTAAWDGRAVQFINTDLDGATEAATAMVKLGHPRSEVSIKSMERGERYSVANWTDWGRAAAADGVGLVVVDHGGDLLTEEESGNDDAAVRGVIGRAKALVGSGLTVVMLGHTNNNGTFGGSQEWRKATRAITKIKGEAPGIDRRVVTTNNGVNLEPFSYRLGDGGRLEYVGPAKAGNAGRKKAAESEGPTQTEVALALLESGGPFGTAKAAAEYLSENWPADGPKGRRPRGWENHISRTEELKARL